MKDMKKVVEVKPKIRIIRELSRGEEVSEKIVATQRDSSASFSDEEDSRSRGGAPVLSRVGEVVEVRGVRRVGEREDKEFAGRQFYETREGVAQDAGARVGNGGKVYTPLESSSLTRSQDVRFGGSGMLDTSKNMLPENERARSMEQERDDNTYRHSERPQESRARRRYPWEV